MSKYEEFELLLEERMTTKSPYIRGGQLLMITLFEFDKDLYDNITATDVDCFYDDKKIEKTLNYLKNNIK